MKRLIIAMLALAVVLPGCGKQRRDVDAEDAEGIGQADTANIESSESAEALPAVDQGEPQSGDSSAEVASPTPSSDASLPTTDDGGGHASSAPPAAMGTGQMATYSVQGGDTLMKIAFNIYGDINQWRNIYELNKDSLANANQLSKGMQLKYDKPASEPSIEKNGDPYMIKKGDTLGTIADDIYAKKSKWKKLYENNRSLIRDPNKIYAGFYLYYQITEEEEREAEEIKAKRGGGGAPLGQGAGGQNDSASAGMGALKGGGLNSLAAPQSGRTPASRQ